VTLAEDAAGAREYDGADFDRALTKRWRPSVTGSSDDLDRQAARLRAAMSRVAARKPSRWIPRRIHSVRISMSVPDRISIPGEDLIIDPLANRSLRTRADPFNPHILKILHGADYDLPDSQSRFRSRSQTSLTRWCARSCSATRHSALGALLERYFGLTVDKSHQRADWAMRRCARDAQYAASDAALIPRR
jgi:hypothetical protein